MNPFGSGLKWIGTVRATVGCGWPDFSGMATVRFRPVVERMGHTRQFTHTVGRTNISRARSLLTTSCTTLATTAVASIQLICN